MAWMPPYVAQVPTARTASAFGSQTVKPFTCRHGLSGLKVISKAAPVAFLFNGLVGDGSFNDEHERIYLAPFGFIKPFDERIGSRLAQAAWAALEVDQRPVNRNFRQTPEERRAQSPRCSAAWRR